MDWNPDVIMVKPGAVTEQPPNHKEATDVDSQSVPSLDCLAHFDQIKVMRDQTMKDDSRRYQVLNPYGQKMYFATDHSEGYFHGECLLLVCAQNAAGRNQVIMTNRHRHGVWKPVRVMDGDGHLMGEVGLIDPDKGEIILGIFEAKHKELMYTITRDGFTIPVTLPIFHTKTNTRIADICCDHGSLGVTVNFPKSMKVEHKALILSAVFLLEWTFKRYFPEKGGFAGAIRNGRGWGQSGRWCC